MASVLLWETSFFNESLISIYILSHYIISIKINQVSLIHEICLEVNLHICPLLSFNSKQSIILFHNKFLSFLLLLKARLPAVLYINYNTTCMLV